MSQLRLDPLTGRWVAIAIERAERPHDFAPRSMPVEADPDRPCPFCPGNEEATPPALETYGPDGSWRVRVVPNRYPAFAGHDALVVQHVGPVFTQARGSGFHEILVLGPDHNLSWRDLEDSQVELVMQSIHDRIAEHARTAGLRYSQLFVNHGREAGASLAHPHGQLLGIPFVPREVAEEVAGFARFRGSCVLCTTLEAELGEGHRVVVDNGDVVVVCPFWSGSPFEMLVIPRAHRAHVHSAERTSTLSAGKALREALARLHRTVGDVAYNLVFHSAPYRVDQAFHWHVHVLPKLMTRAGFELGTGVLVNVMPPEVGAQVLRSA